MGLLTKISEAISDTTTLDVVTATGNIKLTAADLKAAVTKQGDKVSWEKLADKVSEKIKAAEIDVVAFTHSQWDCDTFMFVKDKLTEDQRALLDEHNAVVESAHEQRREAVRLLTDIVKAAIPV